MHHDPATNEKHIADVKTDSGRVLEFQNSPISLDELRSRERFYDDVVWIVNGEKFAKSFFILGAMPDPDAEIVKDIVFFEQRYDSRATHNPDVMFWRKSENPNHKPGDMVRVHSVKEFPERDTARQFEELYAGHHQFFWKRPHSVWFEAEKPVFIDFGRDDSILQLMVYQSHNNHDLRCVQIIPKQQFVEVNGGML